MNDRSFLMPILLLVAIGAPIVYHQMEDRKPHDSQQPKPASPFYQEGIYQDGIGTADARSLNGANLNEPIAEQKPGNELFDSAVYRRSSRNLSAQTHSVPMENSFQTAGFSRPSQTNPTKIDPSLIQPSAESGRDRLQQNQNYQSGIVSLNELPGDLPVSSSSSNTPPNTPFSNHGGAVQPPFQTGSVQTAPAFNGSPNPMPVVSYHPGGQPPMNNGSFVESGLPMAGMVPDYGAAETLVFPGNAYGPDLSAQPMETIPVSDFNEIFRFDITREWIKQRWKRVSTNPNADGLSGLRVALVTGTNSWDLNGALTYYFDRNQKLQRISYRGWAGDPQKLLQMLTSKYKFESQPTNIAGFYLAKNWRKTKSGLLMKEPPVIDTRNVLQQLGIVMEINNPDSSIELSDEFQALIAGSNQE